MDNIIKPKVYVGVYGLYTKGPYILMIKKARGPYLGKWDLPGGGLNFDENVLGCLKREIKEEVGATLKKKSFHTIEEYQCEYTEKDVVKKFHHLAIYYKVDLAIKKLKIDADGQDSLGAKFVNLKDLNHNNTSAVGWKAIKKI